MGQIRHPERRAHAGSAQPGTRAQVEFGCAVQKWPDRRREPSRGSPRTPGHPSSGMRMQRAPGAGVRSQAVADATRGASRSRCHRR
jgi:hypothetical protein